VSDENFLSRWSRKKKESTSTTATAGPTADVAPSQEGAQSPALAAEAPVEAPPPLPPIESLTSESDFAPFMKAEVDPGLKRQAFKKLIEDPRYNIMDGLDVYIDDYSKADPLPEGWLEKMNAVRYLGIFKPAAEEPEATPAAETEQATQLQNPLAEQPLALPQACAPADTLAAEIPPPGVGKAGAAGEGF
jgi:hypothetical protein